MKLYRHLAWDGIRKNSRLYVPYLLTGVGAVSFFYILVALSRLPEGTLPGSGSVQVILNLGSFVLWVFSLLLLFYTHSFLIRRRNREFALYNVLGMGKRDIARILCWETLLSGGISLAGGLALGILLGKLAELGLLRMVGAATDMVYRVSAGGLLMALGLYGAIYLLILISSLLRVRRSTAIQLMRSQAEGEKPPRANWALAVLGILLLAGAYYLAVTIREPLAALTWFFAAVLMVIAATYLLFISGSVTLCRLLQRNPRFYYRKRHFVSVSSLVYRMKRNGAGLASICILGTMVLVMLSSTTCLYFGAEDSLHTRYPRDENITAYFPDRASQSGDLTSLRTAVADAVDQREESHAGTMLAFVNAVADAVRRSGMSAANVWEYRSVSSVMTLRDGVLSPNEGFGDPVDVTLIPLADYNAAMGTDLTLSQGQVYVCRSRTGYQGTSLTLQNGPTWQVAGLLDNFSPSGSDSASVVTQLWLIVPDLSAADALEQVMNRANMGVSRTWHYGFDLDRQLPDAADPVAEAIRRMAQDGGLMENGVLGVESLAENRGDFYGSYGSLFFLGILLSVGFSLAAVLIIYYKQISEGYEDQARFDIMQKVGMTRRDIRSSINSQLLLVFFLPLLLAGLHLAFAFPFVHKLLLLFNLWNTRLLVGTTAASFLAFAALYTLVYRITSNAYYHIVSGGGER